MAVNRHEHLQEVLETHRMAHIAELVDKFREKRDGVKQAIKDKYGAKIYSPFDSGSFKKHTAINIKFDLDVVVPFKKDAYQTLEKLFEEVFNFLDKNYGENAVIRKQKVSVGMEFSPDDDGDIISLDIVPGRELNQDQYLEDNKLNLFVNSSYGLFERNSYIQTNIQNQIDHITAKQEERKIIRLLKIWKNHNNEKNYKSFLLELIAIKAFDRIDISGNLWDKLKKVMQYIKDNITKTDFKLIDPGNSNNNVMDTLDAWDRENLSNRMDTIIKNIESNSENIMLYFPVNEAHIQQSSSQKTYGIKGTTITPSIPSDNQRFG